MGSAIGGSSDAVADTAPVVYIVGTGGFASYMVREAEAIAARGECVLGGVVIDRRFVAADRYNEEVSRHEDAGWRVFTDTEQLFDHGANGRGDAGRPPLLVLPVPIPLHAPLTISGVEAGFHVLCEKPAAGSLEELHAMKAAAERSRRHLWFGFQHPLNPALSEALHQVESGAIGVLTEITCTVGWPRNEAYYRRSPWAGRLTLDGTPVLDSPIQNATAHMLHATLEIAHRGGFQANRVEAEHARVNDIETADVQALRIHTIPRAQDTDHESGPEIFMVTAHSCHTRRDPVITICGAAGELQWSFPDNLKTLAIRPRRAGASTPRDTFDTWQTLHNGPGDSVNGAALRGAIAALASSSSRTPVFTNLVGPAGATRHLAVVAAAFWGADGKAHRAHRFPPPAVDTAYSTTIIDDTGTAHREIIGLDEAMTDMADTHRLPTELPVPWAKAVLQVTGPVSSV